MIMNFLQKTQLPAFSLLSLSAGLLLSVSVMNAEAKLYKWVDENGDVQYSDKLPPQANKGAHSEMSQSGRVVDKKGAAKTAEEIAREQELERLREIQEELVAKQKAEDAVLLKTFRSEQDLVTARDAKLNALDNLITITKGNLKRFKTQLTALQSSAAKQEKSGKQVNKKLTQDIESLERQISGGYASILAREQNKETIFLEYEDDINRFRTLKKLNTPKVTNNYKGQSLPLKTVYECPTEEACSSAWENAVNFVKKHSTTRLQLVGDNLYMTATPESDQQVSLTVTRIKDVTSGKTKIFLDQQCRTTETGKAFCASEESQKIKGVFLPEITGEK